MPSVSEKNHLAAWSSLDEIIEEMDGIIKWSIEKGSRAGYFAALYRKVTIAVKKAIQESAFLDGPRMEKLDVLFAARYLEAFRDYHQGKPVSASWKAAFDSAKSWRPIVFQHLLLGMNAHINLDLGIAAAAACPGDSLEPLKEDFHRINEILIRLMEEVQNSLAEIWWSFNLVNKTTVRTGEALARFSMIKARNQAWETALRLAYLNDVRKQEEIRKIDQKTCSLAKMILHSSLPADAANLFIRMGERGSVRQIIMTLA